MLKKLISPLQKILLQKGICPGCTHTLKNNVSRSPRTSREDKIVCKCGRIYIYDKELDVYRRALDSEV
jgi:hypothetical protein